MFPSLGGGWVGGILGESRKWRTGGGELEGYSVVTGRSIVTAGKRMSMKETDGAGRERLFLHYIFLVIIIITPLRFPFHTVPDAVNRRIVSHPLHFQIPVQWGKKKRSKVLVSIHFHPSILLLFSSFPDLPTSATEFGEDPVGVR